MTLLEIQGRSGERTKTIRSVGVSPLEMTNRPIIVDKIKELINSIGCKKIMSLKSLGNKQSV